jgi:hypothetical protein
VLDNDCSADVKNCKLGDDRTSGIQHGKIFAINYPGCAGPQYQPMTPVSCDLACPCVYDDKTMIQDAACTTTAYGFGSYKAHNPQINGPHSCPAKPVSPDPSCNYAFAPPHELVHTYNPYTPLTGGFEPNPLVENFMPANFMGSRENFTPSSSFDLRVVSGNLATMYLDQKPGIDVIMNYQANLTEAIKIFNDEYNNYVVQCNGKSGTDIPRNANNPNNSVAQVWGPEKGKDIPLNCNDLLTQLNYDADLLNNYIAGGSIITDKVLPQNISFKSLSDSQTYTEEELNSMNILSRYSDMVNQYNKFQTTAQYDASYNFIKSTYPEMVKLRLDLDAKLRDLYDIPGSKYSSLDVRYNYDSTMYTGILLTVMASALLYYTFTKL